MDIGFIGIGAMGAAIVPRLVQAGHRVGAWNRNPVAVRALQGVDVLDSPAAAFAHDVVFTMLADDPAVRAVVLDSGALAAAKPGCIHVMMATISPQLVDELVAAHTGSGIAYVAAPVFGVPAVAAQGQLNILAAGPAAALATLQPVFDVLGRKTWPLGDEPRRANIAKIAGNLMISMAIEAMGEATALTGSYGLKAADFLDIVTNTLFASPSYQRYGGFIGRDTYEPGFKLTLGLKDVNLALSAARAADVHLPGAEAVHGHMVAGVEQGLGDRDWSVLARMAQRGITRSS